MYSHLATPCVRVDQSDKDTKIVYWKDESAYLGFDWRDRKKKILFHVLMPAECEFTENDG